MWEKGNQASKVRLQVSVPNFRSNRLTGLISNAWKTKVRTLRMCLCSIKKNIIVVQCRLLRMEEVGVSADVLWIFPPNTLHPVYPKYSWQPTSWNSVLWTLTCLVCQWLWMFFLCFLAHLASSHHLYFHYAGSKLISWGTSFILVRIPMWILNVHVLPWYMYIFLRSLSPHSICINIYTSSVFYFLH